MGWRQAKIKGNTSLSKEMNNTLTNFTTLAWNYYNNYIGRQQPVTPEYFADRKKADLYFDAQITFRLCLIYINVKPI